jgi:hypothetical protein
MWGIVEGHARVVACARTRPEGLNKLSAKAHAVRVRGQEVSLYLLSPADLKVWHRTRTHKGFWQWETQRGR